MSKDRKLIEDILAMVFQEFTLTPIVVTMFKAYVADQQDFTIIGLAELIRKRVKDDI